jgi:hypothetical protein
MEAIRHSAAAIPHGLDFMLGPFLWLMVHDTTPVPFKAFPPSSLVAA